jgi:hypothetical protein
MEVCLLLASAYAAGEVEIDAPLVKPEEHHDE